MKKLLPSLDELIDRLSVQIEHRHEGKKISGSEKQFLKEKWIGKEKRLLSEVKQLEINYVKHKNALRREETRVVTFCTGIDILGFQTFTTHLLRFENSYKDPKRFKKEGSDFNSVCTHSSQFDFIQNGFKTRLI